MLCISRQSYFTTLELSSSNLESSPYLVSNDNDCIQIYCRGTIDATVTQDYRNYFTGHKEITFSRNHTSKIHEAYTVRIHTADKDQLLYTTTDKDIATFKIVKQRLGKTVHKWYKYFIMCIVSGSSEQTWNILNPTRYYW